MLSKVVLCLSSVTPLANCRRSEAKLYHLEHCSGPLVVRDKSPAGPSGLWAYLSDMIGLYTYPHAEAKLLHWRNTLKCVTISLGLWVHL